MSPVQTPLARDYAAMDDATLVGWVRHGDRDAFRQIMRRCNQRLFRVARGVVGDDAEAEDVVQEAYVHAYEKIDGFRGEASLPTWLTRIVLNAAYGRLRQRRGGLPAGKIRGQRRRTMAQAMDEPPDRQQQDRRAQRTMQRDQPRPLRDRSHHRHADEQHRQDHQRHQPVQQAGDGIEGGRGTVHRTPPSAVASGAWPRPISRSRRLNDCEYTAERAARIGSSDPRMPVGRISGS